MGNIQAIETKPYPIRPVIRIIAMLVFIATIIAIFAINITFLNAGVFKIISFLWVIALINLLLLYITWISGDFAFRAAIILSKEGIQYRYVGKTGFASWSDVTKIQYTQTPRGYFEWIISLNKQLEWQNQISKLLAQLNRKESYRYIPSAFFVSQPKTVDEILKTDFFY